MPKCPQMLGVSAPAGAGETVRIGDNGGGLETQIQRSPFLGLSPQELEMAARERKGSGGDNSGTLQDLNCDQRMTVALMAVCWLRTVITDSPTCTPFRAARLA